MVPRKKKINIDSTEPLNSIAEVDMVVDEFVKRGGYISIEEDMKIRNRISNRNHLASWISYVKNKLIYRKDKIAKHISGARASLKKKGTSKSASSPIARPVKEEQGANVVLKQSLTIDSYSDVCREDPELRPYQQKAKKEIFGAWDEVDNVMFQMPTGTGKTRLFTSIISDINKYSIQRKEAVKILIVAHRTELIRQIGKHLEKYKVPHNIIIGGKEKNYKFPVSVASIQTITNTHNIKRAQKLNVQFIIIDEAHHAVAASYRKLWEMYPNAKRLGVTATPWRMNHQSFTDLFDKLVMSMPIKDFIKQGHLAPYKYYSLKDDSYIQKTIDGIELDNFGEYKESSMEEKMDIGSIRAQLLDSYLSLAEGKKGIIYAINIAHARNICKEYEEAGYRVVCIDSKTPSAERDNLVEKFRKNQIDIIVNVDIFSEGFDCPDIEFIQLARPTRSLVKYLQQVGRGLRHTDNKQNCVILDNVGMYSKFGLPDARRHWKYHFLGKKIDEEAHKVISNGTGKSRYVDLSEGTEDMELIQDDYEDVEIVADVQNESTSAIDDFFPLFGVILGKTTWKDATDMGYKVKRCKPESSRTMNVEKVDFWDHEGEGIFKSIYWTRDESDFPSLWKSKGFDWNLSFDEWIEVFEKMGFSVTVTRQPNQRNAKSAEFGAISPDKTLNFILFFDYGEAGYYTSSPNTLYSITVDYRGPSLVEIVDEPEVEENEEVTSVTLPAVDDFFPLFGVTLGRTTWKDAEDLGAKVKIYEKGPARNTLINNVFFWDHEGRGIFTHVYWVYSRVDNTDFPPSWKSKGFSWGISFDEWLEVFKELHFVVHIKKQPKQRKWSGHTVFSSEFEALSSDGKLSFDMYFDFGKDGFFTSSPNTLYSISVDYKGELVEEKIDINVDIPSTDPHINNEREDAEVKKASVHIDPIKLDKIFDNKATSYKYFWFMAIISLAKEKKSLTIPYKDIIVRMASMAWPIVFEYKIDLGKNDMIANYLNDIIKRTDLPQAVSSKVVEAYLSAYYDSDGIGKILGPLLKNVPYRFLSPWIPYTTDDEVIEKSNSGEYACLYALREDCIEINTEWWDFIKKRILILSDYTKRSFVSYLQTKNGQWKIKKFMAAGWSLV